MRLVPTLAEFVGQGGFDVGDGYVTGVLDVEGGFDARPPRGGVRRWRIDDDSRVLVPNRQIHFLLTSEAAVRNREQHSDHAIESAENGAHAQARVANGEIRASRAW
jgi:hypothetical protein